LRISGLRDPVDGGDEAFPSRSLLREHLSARGVDPVITAPALPRLFDPSTCNPAPFFEAIEQGIERRDAKTDGAFGALLDHLADLIPVPRAVLDERQNQQLRAALFQFAIQDVVDILHSNILLRSTWGVKGQGTRRKGTRRKGKGKREKGKGKREATPQPLRRR
jgi:hypothetical protein